MISHFIDLTAVCLFVAGVLLCAGLLSGAV